MVIKRWTSNKKVYKLKRKGERVNMMTLNAIREKNKSKQSFLNAKITNYTLSQEEFIEGREVFSKFVKPINEKSLCNYLKKSKE